MRPILILGLLVLLAACEPKPSASTPDDQPSSKAAAQREFAFVETDIATLQSG